MNGRDQSREEKRGIWSRRAFFTRLGWGGFAIFGLASMLAFMRAAFPRVLFLPPQTFKAGGPADFVLGEVNEKFKNAGVVSDPEPGAGMKIKSLYILLSLVVFLWSATNAFGHDVPEHLDPELLTGWRTWLHLTIQWTHLVTFALWIGLTLGSLLLKAKASLDHLLYASWMLFLVMLATGSYNMEWSAGISETPSVLSLALLGAIPYGVTYTIVLAIKVALYVLSVLIALVVTLLHVRRKFAEGKLNRAFLISESAVAVLIAFVTAVVLFYHEVADLWPTPVHSLGGVMGPEGPKVQTAVDPNLSPPNDFRLVMSGAAWIDIGARWMHLLGFGLWLGASAVTLVFGPVSAGRFLSVSWASLILQVLSGILSMVRWTPFYVPPYVWNLTELSYIRFGRTYTLLLALKHILVLAAIALAGHFTVRYLKLRKNAGRDELDLRPFAFANCVLGLAVGYVMMIVLLLHEGVDHAL